MANTKKIIITEKQYSRLFFNPVSMNQVVLDYYDQMNGLIAEGYYRTYPTETVLKHINNLCGDEIQDVETNDKNVITVRLGVNEDYARLDKVMELCGYHLARKVAFEDTIAYAYLPKFANNANDEIEKQRYLYHVTPAYNLERILKNGLSPKSTNKQFKYPGRVHFFLERYDDCGGGAFETWEDLMNKASSLYSVIPDISNPKDRRYEDNMMSWAIIKFDAGKLKHLQFYKDPSWDNSAVYTYNNVSPDTIINHHIYNLDDEYPDYDITNN